MKTNDAKALTYTTEPLASDLKVAGTYLEEVDGSGKSRCITQGVLRASHRALGQAPFDNPGLPWHDHFESSLETIPADQPIELVFDLLPKPIASPRATESGWLWPAPTATTSGPRSWTPCRACACSAERIGDPPSSFLLCRNSIAFA
jgi:hypothetical protein